MERLRQADRWTDKEIDRRIDRQRMRKIGTLMDR